MINPLLENHLLPPFREIKAEHVEPAIRQITQENLDAIEALLDQNTSPSWDTLVTPLEDLEDRLNKAWSPVSHLNSVMNNAELRAAYNLCLPLLSDYATKIGQNERLYQAYVLM